MDIKTIKKRLRKLKQLEIRLRNNNDNNLILIWDKYFNFSQKCSSKYTLAYLSSLSDDEYRAIVLEYLSFVYYTVYVEDDTNEVDSFVTNRELLEKLGLPHNADYAEVKARFRKLAKVYHPDMGGNEESFRDLMSLHHKLTNNK